MNPISFNGDVSPSTIVMVGFGSVGQGVLPLLAKHFDVAKQLKIINPCPQAKSIADHYQVAYYPQFLTQDNYQEILRGHLKPGDFLLNLSVDVSSYDLICLAQEIGCLYLDTCIEPWAGGYTDPKKSLSDRSNYALRERVLSLRTKLPQNGPTAVIAHGANPGLVSHLVKQALINVADDLNCLDHIPETRDQWAHLAHKLHVKSIHIAEHDWQTTNIRKQANEFVNTWSIDGFYGEGCQPAELGWGSHEKNWPKLARKHDHGCKAAIYLDQPGLKTAVKTWTPLGGQIKAFLITHNEAISLADYFSLTNEDRQVIYRPTVHYSYRPCDDAILSLHELSGRDLNLQMNKRLLRDEIVDGIDELGVLLMGHERGAYWFGSHLSIHDARKIAPYNSATTLQITSSVLAGVLWALENPNRSLVEPEEMDFQRVLEITKPYLGPLVGEYTNWTPLLDQQSLYPKTVDTTDPWQFVNFMIDERH
ncbi:MAG TPA: saccharopine dehydrogenase C-terminal domain-containing protein [Candidatus Nitrosotenuis sp.]|nr:saccharopine dehydrogenase C-terminal domain-containing protein [Candidatus Nitrosotenuis sp.]